LLVAAAAASGQTPLLLSFSPQQIAAGSGDTKIKISGYGLTATMQMLWNGQPRTTEFVNQFLLKATIPQSDTATPTLAQITVVDTASAQSIGQPTPVLVYLPVAHNDLVYDSARSKIYLSVSKQDANGPALAIVNPDAGLVERYIALPSEPGPLAVSADSTYLYIGMADRIRRMDLTGASANVDIPASSFQLSPSGGVQFSFSPQSLLPLPSPTTSFILIASVNGFQQGFVVDGTKVRPKYSNSPGNCLVGTPDGITIYSGPGLQVTKLLSDGLPYTPDYSNSALVVGPACPVYAGGLIFSSGGDVVDPVSRSRVQWLPAIGNVAASANPSLAFFTDRLGGSATGVPSLRFEAFDASSGALLKSVPLGIQMDISNGGAVLGRLLHWGTDGFAFGNYTTLNSSTANWLYLIHVN
jgi:hypothetical protein